MKIMTVANFESWPGALEISYERAFQELGCQTVRFDIHASLNRYARLGKPGRLFNQFVPIEAWGRKANREMLDCVIREQPDVIFLVGSQPVRAGALAQAQLVSPARLVYVWPDTLGNLSLEIIACLPLFDMVGTYAQASTRAFEKLGARRVLWLPLAADPHLHPPRPPAAPISAGDAAYAAEICFIGGWRPEREALLAQLGEFDLKIWGPYWKRRSRDPAILRAWQGRPLLGAEFARAVSASKININIIDDTNGQAPNMRFFELCVSGGLQLSTPCPEMSGEFRHGKHLFYFQDARELPDLIRTLLADDALRARVAQAGHEQVLGAHLYVHRARQLLRELEELEPIAT